MRQCRTNQGSDEVVVVGGHHAYLLCLFKDGEYLASLYIQHHMCHAGLLGVLQHGSNRKR